MYAIDWASLFVRTHRNCSACVTCPHKGATKSAAKSRWLPAVSQTVWALGFTSLFTDISSEMIASVLPMYLVLQLGMQPLVFGVIDGLYQGAAALVRVIAGVVADRWQRHKDVATAGYGMSALCRIGLLAAGSTWGAIAGIVAFDRIGKGIRTAPRDALISLRSPCRELATAFGVHRGLDAAGAMLGPLAAFLLLASMPGRFDVLFAASFVIAVIGVAMILLFVEPAPRRVAPRERRAPIRQTRVIDAPGFKGIVIAGLLLALPTISDAFIFLALQRRLGWGNATFPLFYVATSLFTALFSVPVGRLADQRGRKPVLFAGYGLLVAVYVLLLVPGAPMLVAALAITLLGAYYAATDGVLTAIAAAALPSDRSGSGLAYLATASNLGKVGASVLFGFIWGSLGVNAAITVYLPVLTAAIFMSRRLLAADSAPAGLSGQAT